MAGSFWGSSVRGATMAVIHLPPAATTDTKRSGRAISRRATGDLHRTLAGTLRTTWADGCIINASSASALKDRKPHAPIDGCRQNLRPRQEGRRCAASLRKETGATVSAQKTSGLGLQNHKDLALVATGSASRLCLDRCLRTASKHVCGEPGWTSVQKSHKCIKAESHSPRFP